MEANRQMEMKLDDKEYTYVFQTKEEMATKSPSKIRRKIWQIFPSVCGTMMVLPFGIMLGWPSPTYPTLIKPESPVPISLDQSAMVAGFLMIGNTVATPFSSMRRFGAKYGIIFGVFLMTVGWILMWQAKDIYWLLGSRFLIGAGNGYGVGQLKFYINEMCQDSLAQFLIKQINLYIFSGVILAFAYGPFVDFRQFSIIASIISILVLFLAIFLPSTPRELLRSGKVPEATKLVAFLSPQVDVGAEIAKIKEKINLGEKHLSFCDIVRQAALRKSFLIFTLLVFCQQFSGAPATIVYSQIIFAESHCPRPELCALVYSFVFFLANGYGIFCTPNHNKKHVFLFSSVGVSLLLGVKILVLVEKVNDTFWGFTSLVVLILFNIVHTVGLGNVPFSLISELFPKEANKVVVHFFVMFHSMLALTITKIFQTMYDRLGLFAPFCLFLTISTFSIIFVIIFVPNKKKKPTGIL
ncbi:facilitated trehalose transporter Tret1 [Asbolus verrucosus]|uniref:Facilitated trehalose transporter Tret1 n=1 Tax=Asbolus verrucosus TaxID=1661398 RepID=A0A482WB51_ASBVE|nr:facilitated trehalose transporter Tret1 [Asbolus verrucosus]